MRPFLVCALVVVLVGCSAASSDAPATSAEETPIFSSTPTDDPDVATTATPTATTTDEVSGEVTPADVDEILAGISAEQARLLDEARRAGTVDAVQEEYQSIATTDETLRFLGSLRDVDLASVLADPVGTPVVTTTEVLDTTDSCILVRAEVDDTPLVRDPSVLQTYDEPWHVQLERAPDGSGSRGWLLSFRLNIVAENDPMTCDEMDALRPGYT